MLAYWPLMIFLRPFYICYETVFSSILEKTKRHVQPMFGQLILVEHVRPNSQDWSDLKILEISEIN